MFLLLKKTLGEATTGYIVSLCLVIPLELIHGCTDMIKILIEESSQRVLENDEPLGISP